MRRSLGTKKTTTTKPVEGKDKKVELSVVLMRKMMDISEAHGAKFMVMDIPVRRNRSEFLSRFPYDAVAHLPSLQIVSPLDAFEAAVSGPYAGEKIYWERSHGHFTPLGCDLAGMVLADFIAENNLLQ